MTGVAAMTEAGKRPAFVTGGSSGIGLAAALQLAGSGHPLALLARDNARLEAARRLIEERVPGARVEIFAADVSQRQACTEAVLAAIRLLGAPEWAIASAGIAEPGEFVEQSLDAHEAQMAVNYFGSLYFAHAVVGAMKSGGGGRLVFISSGAAFVGIYGYSAYAPSKFAVRGLAEILRIELAPLGIGVSLCYPPDTDTPQLAAEARTKPEATKIISSGGGLWSPEKVAEMMLRKAARGRFVVAPGFQMALLSQAHSLLAPLLRSYQSRVVRRLRC